MFYSQETWNDNLQILNHRMRFQAITWKNDTILMECNYCIVSPVPLIMSYYRYLHKLYHSAQMWYRWRNKLPNVWLSILSILVSSSYTIIYNTSKGSLQVYNGRTSRATGPLILVLHIQAYQGWERQFDLSFPFLVHLLWFIVSDLRLL